MAVTYVSVEKSTTELPSVRVRLWKIWQKHTCVIYICFCLYFYSSRWWRKVEIDTSWALTSYKRASVVRLAGKEEKANATEWAPTGHMGGDSISVCLTCTIQIEVTIRSRIHSRFHALVDFSICCCCVSYITAAYTTRAVHTGDPSYLRSKGGNMSKLSISSSRGSYILPRWPTHC